MVVIDYALAEDGDPRYITLYFSIIVTVIYYVKNFKSVSHNPFLTL